MYIVYKHQEREKEGEKKEIEIEEKVIVMRETFYLSQGSRLLYFIEKIEQIHTAFQLLTLVLEEIGIHVVEFGLVVFV